MPVLQRGVPVIFFKTKSNHRELQPVHRQCGVLRCFFFYKSSSLVVCLLSFFKKYLNVPNLLACLASPGK